MSDRLDVVPVGVEHEDAVVALVVVGAQSRGAVVATADGERPDSEPERLERALVESPRSLEVADVDADVVEHAPQLTRGMSKTEFLKGDLGPVPRCSPGQRPGCAPRY